MPRMKRFRKNRQVLGYWWCLLSF